MLNSDEINKIASLANLPLTEEEITLYSQDLTNIIDYNMKLLGQVSTDGVEATAHVGGQDSVLRDDVPAPSLSQEEVLKNAKNTQDGYFKVPPTIDFDQ